MGAKSKVLPQKGGGKQVENPAAESVQIRHCVLKGSLCQLPCASVSGQVGSHVHRAQTAE